MSARICAAASRLGLSSGRSRAASTGAVQLSRAKLSWQTHCQAQPAMTGWPCEWREGWQS
jgi:hypothetical protein